MPVSAILLAIAAAAVVAGFVLPAAAVRRGWFARMRGGFQWAMVCSLAGTSLAVAAAFGAWGYVVARSVIFESRVQALAEVGGAAEANLHGQIATLVNKLTTLAASPMVTLAAQNNPSAHLRELQTFNPRLLQISIYDRAGNRIASSNPDEASEPSRRVGVAYAMDGKSFVSEPYFSSVFNRYVLYLCVPVCSSTGGEPIGAISLRYDFQNELAQFFEGVKIGKSGYIVLSDASGKVLAHPDGSRVGDGISEYAGLAAARESASGWAIGANKAGVQRLYVHRLIDNPSTLPAKPLILLTEIDAAEALAPVRKLETAFAIGAGVLLILGALVAKWLGESLIRPLSPVLSALENVREGDLTARVAVHGRDELARLGEALNAMAAGLQERDRVKQLFGRYVTTQVSEQILAGHVDLGGHSRHCTILFSDIRNFTSMSEGMSPHQIVELLNEYFTEMVDAVFENGGVLDKFIGDGMLATFGALDDAADHARRAVMAGLRMKAKLAKMNGDRAVRGLPPIDIGIGIHTADVVVGNIGSRKRLEYTVIGDGVNTCSRVESMNKQFGTTLLITGKTHDQIDGAFECRQMPDAALKGKSIGVKLYEVLSVKPIAKAA